jgi:hypothetical protein
VSDAWEDEGFGAENDWGEESLETDLEEDDVLEQAQLDPSELDDDVDDDEQ